MTTPADLLYTMLIGQSVLGDYPAFVSFLPDQPDKAVCIYDTPGTNDGRLMTTGERIEHPGVQIFVRSLEYLEGHQKAQSLATLLDGLKNISIAVSPDETYSLRNVTRSGTINWIGIEIVNDKRRHQFTINAVLTLTRLS